MNCPTPIEPYSGQPIETQCERLPNTGASVATTAWGEIAFFLILIGVIILVLVRHFMARRNG